MTSIAIEAAAKQLRELVDSARSGEEVVLTDNAGPAARLVPIDRAETVKEAPAAFGFMRDRLIYMADDFDAPLDEFAEYM